MAHSSLTITLEIEKMQIVVAERVPLVDLIKKTIRKKYSKEYFTTVRKTHPIQEDSDTQRFIKYLLHHKVKANVAEEFKYEEMPTFGQVNKFKMRQLQGKSLMAGIIEKEKNEAERMRIEQEIIKEAFDAQILDMDQFVDSTVNNNQAVGQNDDAGILQLRDEAVTEPIDEKQKGKDEEEKT